MAADVLAQLLRKAHSEYKANVPSNMTRKIFVKQFINGHRYGSGTTIGQMNDHCKALGMVEVLLTDRTDLVGYYFGKPELTDEDITEMMRLLYTETRIDDDGNPIVHNPLKCALGEEDWPVIMECVNKNHFFTRDVSVEETRGLLHCSLDEPLTVKDLKALCYLMDEFNDNDLISHQWQTPIEQSQSLMLARTNNFVKATTMSTALSRVKNEPQSRPFMADIDLLIEHLKGESTSI